MRVPQMLVGNSVIAPTRHKWVHNLPLRRLNLRHPAERRYYHHAAPPPHWIYEPLVVRPDPFADKLLRRIAILPKIKELKDFIADVRNDPSSYDDKRLSANIDKLAETSSDRLELLTLLSLTTNTEFVVYSGLQTAIGLGEFSAARNFLSRLATKIFMSDQAVSLLRLIEVVANKQYDREFRFGSWKQREALMLIMGDTPNVIAHLDLSDSNLRQVFHQTIASLGGLRKEPKQNQAKPIDHAAELEAAVSMIEETFSPDSCSARSPSVGLP